MAYDDSRYAQMGPFTGGLNTYSQIDSIDDTELTVCDNLIQDIDGALKCRYPLVRDFDNPSGFGNVHVNVIGTAIINATNYIFASNASGIWYSTGNGTWTLITGTVNRFCNSCVQYNNIVYFVADPTSVNGGGSWNGTTFTAVAAIPRGQACLIYKERMWIAPGKHATSNQSRLYFSNIADPTTWPGPNFFDITPGDGQNLVDLRIFNNNLLLFKQQSTYYLTYDSSPTNAQIVKISNTIGASNWRCVAEYKGDIYVMFETSIFQLINLNWVEINVKVPFDVDTTVPVWSDRDIKTSLSVIGDLLVCRFHNKTYCYNINNQTWCTWSSPDESLHNFGPFTMIPADGLYTKYNSYYAGNALFGAASITRIRDGWDSTTRENAGYNLDIICTLRTKSYSYGIPWKMKRLWHWGADCTTTRDISGTVYPVSTQAPPNINQVVPGVSGVYGKFYRFPKGLRFREIQYGLVINSIGATTDGLASVRSLVASLGSTQTAPKAVN